MCHFRPFYLPATWRTPFLKVTSDTYCGIHISFLFSDAIREFFFLFFSLFWILLHIPRHFLSFFHVWVTYARARQNRGRLNASAPSRPTEPEQPILLSFLRAWPSLYARLFHKRRGIFTLVRIAGGCWGWCTLMCNARNISAARQYIALSISIAVFR